MTINSFAAAGQAILEGYAAALEAFDELGKGEEFTRIASSPIQPERVSQLLELVYAQRENLPQEIIDLGVAVGRFATEHAFYGLGEDNRGFNILAVLAGNEVADPPEPKPNFT